MPTNPVKHNGWVCLCGCFSERTASNLHAEKRIYVLTEMISINPLQAQTEQKGGGACFLSWLGPKHPSPPALIPVMGL